MSSNCNSAVYKSLILGNGIVGSPEAFSELRRELGTFTPPSLVIVGKAPVSRLYVSTYFGIRELFCLSFQAAG